jgi:hypothetical protein
MSHSVLRAAAISIPWFVAFRVTVGIEVPPFIAALFRVDALTVLKLGDFNGGMPSLL